MGAALSEVGDNWPEGVQQDESEPRRFSTSWQGPLCKDIGVSRNPRDTIAGPQVRTGDPARIPEKNY